MNPFNFGGGNNDDDQNKNNFNLLPIIPPNYAVVKNDKDDIRVNKVGFSFTCLIFGVLPAIFRGDWYNLFCMLGIEAFCVMLLTYVTGMDLYTSIGELRILFEIVWGFSYNFMYFRHLQNLGYKPVDKKSAELLKSHHYYK